MSQTTYNEKMDVSFEGMLADSGRIDALSALIEGSDIAGFGLAVKRGTAENQVAALSANTDKVAGVVIHKHVESGLLEEFEDVSILRKGRIVVKVEEAVVAGDPVFVRAVTAGLEVAGAFRKSADSTDCIALTNCEFVTGAGIGGLAVVDLNLP